MKYRQKLLNSHVLLSAIILGSKRLFKLFTGTLGSIFNLIILGCLSFALIMSLLISYYGKELPTAEDIENYNPETLSRIYDSSGNVLGMFGQKKRIYTPISDIPNLVKNAFISAEDKNFYVHVGYDPFGLLKAITDVFRGKKLRGASTITQQVMKNFLLSGERTGKRKIRELILAFRIERVLSKNEILNVYLNEIYLGQGAYGVTAASITYFGKPLEQLNVAEAAYLAALPKAPSFYHPIRQKQRSIGRRNFVIRELNENGYISKKEADKYSAYTLSTKLSRSYDSKDLSLSRNASYFNDQINRTIKTKYPKKVLETEGLTIMATLDPNIQKVAEQSLQTQLVRFDESKNIYRGPVAKILLDEVESLEKVKKSLDDLNLKVPVTRWNLAVVRAVYGSFVELYVQGSNKELSVGKLRSIDFNWIKKTLINGQMNFTNSVQDIFSVGDVIYVEPSFLITGKKSHWQLKQIPEVQGAFLVMEPNTGKVIAMQGGFSYSLSTFNRASQAKRQPGSAFKPFVYLTALENGFYPNSIVVDAPISVGLVNGVWRPKNATSEWFGAAPLRKGLEHSRNLMTVRLAKELGMQEIARYAKIFGIYNEMPNYLSFSLGTGETTLLDLVKAYSILANGGLEIDPTFFDLIQNRFGKTIYKHGFLRCLGCTVESFETAKKPIFLNLGSRLIDPISVYQINSMLQGVVKRGTGAKTVGTLGIDIAGKTGTTNGAKDLWFIGYTPEIVAGCYIGYDIPKSLGNNASGGKYCGEAFKDFYKKIYGNKTVTWNVPKGSKFVEIDYSSGNIISNVATPDIVISELYREDEKPMDALVGNAHDGGLGMGQDLLLLNKDQAEGKNNTLRRSYGAIVTGDQY